MSSGAIEGWSEANQRYLVARLAILREQLRRFAGSDAAPPGGAGAESHDLEALEQAAEEAASALPAPSALDQVGAAFGLSPFERGVLLLAAGVELDTQMAACCAAARRDPRGVHPTFSLALAFLPGAHWSAITAAGPLRRFRLIEVGSGDTLTGSPLSISERVLHHLTGIEQLDERLAGLVEPLFPTGTLAASQQALAARIASMLPREGGAGAAPAIHLAGEDVAGKRAVAAHVAASLGVPLHLLRGGDLPATPAEREALLRLWDREALLSASALLVDCEELEGAAAWRAVTSFAERALGVVLVASRSPVRLDQRRVARVEVAKATAAEQRAFWQEVLGPAASLLDGRIDAVVSNFDLGTEGIRSVAVEVTGQGGEPGEEDLGRRIWDVCRAKARPRLDDLAQRIKPAARWEDLVLPEEQRRVLRDIAAHARQRHRVYETWGFGRRSARGLGISALFAGVSGTGKTMAAEVLARDLEIDLYSIDLSQMVSKYIGETEKNLKRVFDAADEGGAILLFDEADALFGKRSEVKDSHDRYANIEVSYLLQRMEAYRGLAVLTTNMKAALDQAFLRRLRFVVTFPFPDASLRAEIWRRIFPPAVPAEGLDVQKLARLHVAGGNIRNIALNAAFLAADAGEPVKMSHLLRAAQAECGKLEKPLTDVELGGWVG